MESWAATPVFSLPELAQLGGPLSPYLQGRVRADIRRCVMDEASYVGIDVSKARLDVAIHPGAKSLQVANNACGIAELVSLLEGLTLDVVVLEATGGYEMEAWTALSDSGMPVAVVNPRHVREFARATGRLAKTDRIDAEVLARFAEAVKPEPRLLPDS